MLVEKFLHDINLVSNSTSSDDVYSNQLDYCLHKRGWLILNALLSSNIKVFPIQHGLFCRTWESEGKTGFRIAR